jgi:hypothetical protein
MQKVEIGESQNKHYTYVNLLVDGWVDLLPNGYFTIKIVSILIRLHFGQSSYFTSHFGLIGCSMVEI